MQNTRMMVPLYVLSAFCVLAVALARAQDFPTRPITLIVPNSPGTSHDLVARIIAPDMSKLIGQSIVVENKPGAAETIGYAYVAKQAPANGYTLVLALPANLATLPLTIKGLSFDPLKDLPPVIGLVEGRYIFGLSSQLPWKTFKELVDHAKANPGKLNWGTSSPLSRLTTEALLRDLGLEVVFIPYGGGGPYIQALVAGQIQMGFVGEAAVAGLGDKFRVLALTGAQRSARFPEAPTFIELGRPQIQGLTFSLNTAVGVPRPALDKLHSVASRALRQPEVRASFSKILFDVVEQAPEAAAKSLAEQARLFSEIAKKSGIQPE